jgi:hypothetical protein
MRLKTLLTLLSAAATCVLTFATPAIAELGHPSGCANCPPIEIAGPTQGSDRKGAATGSMLSIGFPSGGTALATEERRRPHARGRHLQLKR